MTGVVVVIGTAVCVLLLWALYVLPKWQIERVQGIRSDESFKLENEARRTIAQVIGGVAILAGLVFTFLQFQEERSINRLNVAQARDQQLTDLFTTAIDQFGRSGEDQLAVRLGGIYALERIARESGRDHWPIMEVLKRFS